MTLLEYMTFMRNVKFNTQFIEIWIDGESEGLSDISTEVTLHPNPYISEKDFQNVSMEGLSSCEIDSIGDGHWDSQIIYLKHYKELYDKYKKLEAIEYDLKRTGRLLKDLKNIVPVELKDGEDD